MEGAKLVWNSEKQRQLTALGFVYDKYKDKWIKSETKHEEFVWATANYLYWFDTENHSSGSITGGSKFPILDFDALIIFLRALKSIKELAK